MNRWDYYLYQRTLPLYLQEGRPRRNDSGQAAAHFCLALPCLPSPRPSPFPSALAFRSSWASLAAMVSRACPEFAEPPAVGRGAGRLPGSAAPRGSGERRAAPPAQPALLAQLGKETISGFPPLQQGSAAGRASLCGLGREIRTLPLRGSPFKSPC